MIAAVHALTGAALSRLCRSRTQALALGGVSHIAADLAPHRDLDIPQEAMLLGCALGLIAVTRGPNSREFAGALGATFPDAENLLARLGGIPDSRLLVPTHRNCHGRKTSGFLGQLALAALCLAALSLPDRSCSQNPRRGKSSG
jgi:hypothetical protein